MDYTQREKLIRNYVEAYNQLDIAGMLADLDDEIRFVNITDGEINLSLLGRRAFWDQAVQAAELFSERKQEILAVQHSPEETEIEINYSAKLAVDLPNGYERGQVISMKGRSIFRFGTDKIISLTDIS
ncbi:nuclear transport factor 2 family protein [Sphingobacterium spiritivorum]|uniref:nuclear transport factor 2 family protein n=1 Tax=Sphingobacterium spiritivorum TaxID=258 RepID=UPI003DA244BE